MGHCVIASEGAVLEHWIVDRRNFGPVDGMTDFLRNVWQQEEGQDVAEYAIMLAVILTIAIGTIRLIGSHAGTVFASVGSAIQ
jgi:Flp pilus assembly pilin Flp